MDYIMAFLMIFFLEGTSFNFVFIVLSIIGIYRAEKHCKYKPFFVAYGILFAILILGNIVGDGLTIELLICYSYTIILFLITYPIAKRKYNRNKKVETNGAED